MIITVEQQGGFIGYLRHDLDTADLPEDDANRLEIERLVGRVLEDDSAISSLAAEPVYHVIVHRGEIQARVTYGMTVTPEHARRLVELVRERGKPFSTP
jgi:hypothetical protein